MNHLVRMLASLGLVFAIQASEVPGSYAALGLGDVVDYTVFLDAKDPRQTNRRVRVVQINPDGSKWLEQTVEGPMQEEFVERRFFETPTDDLRLMLKELGRDTVKLNLEDGQTLECTRVQLGGVVDGAEIRAIRFMVADPLLPWRPFRLGPRMMFMPPNCVGQEIQVKEGDKEMMLIHRLVKLVKAVVAENKPTMAVEVFTMTSGETLLHSGETQLNAGIPGGIIKEFITRHKKDDQKDENLVSYEGVTRAKKATAASHPLVRGLELPIAVNVFRGVEGPLKPWSATLELGLTGDRVSASGDIAVVGPHQEQIQTLLPPALPRGYWRLKATPTSIEWAGKKVQVTQDLRAQIDDEFSFEIDRGPDVKSIACALRLGERVIVFGADTAGATIYFGDRKNPPVRAVRQLTGERKSVTFGEVTYDNCLDESITVYQNGVKAWRIDRTLSEDIPGHILESRVFVYDGDSATLGSVLQVGPRQVGPRQVGPRQVGPRQ